MERPLPNRFAALLGVLALLPCTGCLHQILATGIYIIEGGNLVDADCDAMQGRRVVVFCRPPASSDFSHAGASRQLAKRVTSLLAQNVEEIDVVDPREVDQWLDENDSDDYEALAEAVNADMVLRIELDSFDLYNGMTLYQGNADVTLAVYDMQNGGRMLWDQPLGELRFPVHSGIPAQDKPVRQFQREFVDVLAGSIARHFYRHDPNADFAIDALANK